MSAFNYAIIGSDTDAALYYLSVILNSGDLESAIRRIRDAAYMCIGLASPSAVDTAVLACQTAEKIGLPRASTNLAYATITLCLAPKSDSAWKSYERAPLMVKNLIKCIRCQLICEILIINIRLN